jgi:hypothetical protein
VERAFGNTGNSEMGKWMNIYSQADTPPANMAKITFSNLN